ncbi:MAG: adenylosuccinate synthetase, partial [Clostridiales bacterium]|nr:adenylosuccinate synthetase [Clostridiales bacterium]
GNGMVVDIVHLCGEIARLKEGGIRISPENLKISDRAMICMPYRVRLDCLEEMRLADKKYGSTNRGIAPVYGDKYMKKCLRMIDLFESEDVIREKVGDLLGYKNLTVEKVYGDEPFTVDGIMEWLHEFGDPIKPFICDAGEYLDNAAASGKSIMFEAQLGALRDIDFGIYPFTSSSNAISAYAPIGAGIPNRKVDFTLGIMKAYSTCVGEGPFVCEMFGDEAEELRAAGGEYGAATGRPRRVGPFDVVASKYGVFVQGADALALTKLDTISYMKKIPVCVAYDVHGVRTEKFPIGHKLDEAKPIVEYLDGWNCDISKCRGFDELPAAAKDYVLYIEKAVGCKIKYISVGAEREAYIER